jgi:hypothetical protein
MRRGAVYWTCASGLLQLALVIGPGSGSAGCGTTRAVGDAGGPADVHDAAAVDRDDGARPDQTAAFDRPLDVAEVGEMGDMSAASDGGDLGDAATDVANDAAAAADVPCLAPMTRCGQACVALDTSGDHCGRCDHSCLGGPCQASVCQPVTIATGQKCPNSVLIAGDHVYWSNYGTEQPPGEVNQHDGQIVRRALAIGSSPEVLADNQGGPISITQKDGQLYWAAIATKEIWQSALDGSGAATVATGESVPLQVSTDSTRLIWTRYGSVRARPLAGGPVTTLVSGQTNYIFAASSDGTNLYWLLATSGGHTGSVNSIPLAGGPNTALVSMEPTGAADTGAMQRDGSALFWVDTSPGQLRTVATDGTGLATLATGLSFPVSLALAPDAIWVVAQSTVPNMGTIWRVPRGPGMPVAVASGQNRPIAIATDARLTVWANYSHTGTDSDPCRADGTVVLLAK